MGARVAVARVVCATMAVLEEQLTLRFLLALLPDLGSGFQTLPTILGLYVAHFAVAFVLYTF